MKHPKFSLQILLLLITALATSRAQDGIPNQQEDFATKEVRESLQRYRETLLQADSMSRDEVIPKLGEMIVRTFRWQDDKSMAVYTSAQQKLLSIPGHATHYRDKIKAAQVAVKEGRMTWNAWDRLRSGATQTLQHMPSEEAVEVLANFLEDNFACADSDNPADYQIEGLDGYIREWDMSVREPAKSALVNIGIENPPSATETHIKGGALRRAWRQWWLEVKEGKRKYRFKGSSVEHPINPPPGTVREVRRPGREVAPSSESKSEASPAPVVMRKQPEKPKDRTWLLIAAGMVVLSAAATCFSRRRAKE